MDHVRFCVRCFGKDFNSESCDPWAYKSEKPRVVHDDAPDVGGNPRRIANNTGRE